MRQVMLKSKNTHLTAWLDRNYIKPGDLVTLKPDAEILWEVVWVSETTRDELPDKTWKVGGLK